IRQADGKAIRSIAFRGIGPLPAVGWEFAVPPPRKGYVEFDFSALPREGDGLYSFTVAVLTGDEDTKVTKTVTRRRNAQGKGGAVARVCSDIDVFLRERRFDCDVVDDTKLRVYGRFVDGKYIPVTKGIVESSDLAKDEIPKVNNPTKK